jgi:hypothetical protein
MKRESSNQANTPLAVFLSASQDPEAVTNTGRRGSTDVPVVK